MRKRQYIQPKQKQKKKCYLMAEKYGWHISDLKIYDKPKELKEFRQCHKCEHYFHCKAGEYSCDGVYKLTRLPQSWCYVEEVTET